MTAKVKVQCFYILLSSVICIFVLLTISCADGENIFFPRRFVFRQNPPITYKIKSDPKQVKRNRVTRDNMFGWLNLKNYVRFHSWSRDNPELAHEIKVNDLESLRTSSFNSKRLTKFIIHGYQDNANELAVGDWIIFIRDAYLSLADVNVIAVDYSFYATTPFYFTAVNELAAEKLKDMLQFLMSSTNLDLNSVHLVGWSWGAHIAGLTGHALKGRLGRITGLDPAGPTFKFMDNEFRLDKSDAQFVDIIHTNGGTRLFWGGHFGIRDPLGHVDIYPNGGERQNGCPVEHTFNPESLLCNHGRAGRYFTESINSPLAFPMCPCDNFDKFVRDECACPSDQIAYLGEHMSRKTRGIFQLITRSHYPYGHGPLLNVSLSSISYLDDTTNSFFVEVESDRIPAGKKTGSSEPRRKNSTGSMSSHLEVHPGGVQDMSDSNDSSNNTETLEHNSVTTPHIGTAVIQYKNSSIKFQFRNRYRTKEYPNEDILRMSLYAYRKMSADHAQNR